MEKISKTLAKALGINHFRLNDIMSSDNNDDVNTEY